MEAGLLTTARKVLAEQSLALEQMEVDAVRRLEAGHERGANVRKLHRSLNQGVTMLREQVRVIRRQRLRTGDPALLGLFLRTCIHPKGRYLLKNFSIDSREIARLYQEGPCLAAGTCVIVGGVQSILRAIRAWCGVSGVLVAEQGQQLILSKGAVGFVVQLASEWPSQKGEDYRVCEWMG